MMALPSLWVASGEAPAQERFANVHYRRAFLLLRRKSELSWTRVVLTPFGRRRQAMPPQNVADRLIRYAMAEIGQDSHDAIIAPSGILPREADNQCFQFGCDPRPAGIGAMPRPIKLAGDQFSVPAQDGVWFGHAGYLFKSFTPEPFS